MINVIMCKQYVQLFECALKHCDKKNLHTWSQFIDCNAEYNSALLIGNDRRLSYPGLIRAFRLVLIP